MIGHTRKGATEQRSHVEGSPISGSYFLNRRHFLRVGGLAAGLLWVPGYVLRMVGARADELDSPFEILNQPFPIGLWHPPPPAETTSARYQEIADAGFTFVIGGNGVTTPATVRPALDAAEAAGLDYLITDQVLQGRIRSGAATIVQRVQNLVSMFGAHPAAAGLNLFDEPSTDRFPFVVQARDALLGAAPEFLPYTNAWPSYAGPASWGAPTYEEYIDSLLEIVSPPVLSFDHYPLLEGSAITDDYFFNWSVIRERALAAGVPSWVFIQSVDFTGERPADRRRPTESELLWQVNVSLTYGAKGIMYFTYWTPAEPAFGQALISKTGERTGLYDAAARTNMYLASVGGVLSGLTSESVAHANESPEPLGARPFTGDGFVAATDGDPVILGLFSGPKANRRYLMVTNRSFEDAATGTLELTGSVDAIFKFDPSDNNLHPVPARGHRRRLTIDLEPGAAALYELRTNRGKRPTK